MKAQTMVVGLIALAAVSAPLVVESVDASGTGNADTAQPWELPPTEPGPEQTDVGLSPRSEGRPADVLDTVAKRLMVLGQLSPVVFPFIFVDFSWALGSEAETQ